MIHDHADDRQVKGQRRQQQKKVRLIRGAYAGDHADDADQEPWRAKAQRQHSHRFPGHCEMSGHVRLEHARHLAEWSDQHGDVLDESGPVERQVVAQHEHGDTGHRGAL